MEIGERISAISSGYHHQYHLDSRDPSSVNLFLLEHYRSATSVLILRLNELRYRHIQVSVMSDQSASVYLLVTRTDEMHNKGAIRRKQNARLAQSGSVAVRSTV